MRPDMTEPSTNHRRFHALRVSTTAVAPEWWAAAKAHSSDAPRPVRALLGGRTRVELTAEEAVLAIHWASRLSGWGDDGEHPLVVYPPLTEH
jgi:hypothetical protein